MKHSRYHSISCKFPPGKAHSPDCPFNWAAAVKRTIYATVVLFAVAGSPLFAQKLKLHEALELGKGNFPFLKAKQAEIHSAESRIKSVKK
jgi:hypothetical protein